MYREPFRDGKSDIWYNICNIFKGWIDIDTKNNVMPDWHDESYYDRYVNSHLNDFHIIESGYLNDTIIPKTTLFMISKSYFFDNRSFRNNFSFTNQSD